MDLTVIKQSPSPCYKVILVGEPGVGRRSLLHRRSGHPFPYDKKTSGVDFYRATLSIDEQEHNVEFWTATSNERFVYVNRIFAGRSHACLMVFDVTNRRSFDIIPDLIDKVRDIAGVSVVMMLTATKIDLPDRVVTTDEAQLLANRYGLMYAETSSADNEGITEAVDTTIRTVVDKLASGELVVQEYIRLVNKPEPTGSSCCWS